MVDFTQDELVAVMTCLNLRVAQLDDLDQTETLNQATRNYRNLLASAAQKVEREADNGAR